MKGEGCWICGIEILEGAIAVQSKPFRGSTAFVIGNEVSPPITSAVPSLHADANAWQGTRLSSEQIDICDYFVYVPQYGGPDSPVHSLSTIVALSICLQHFGTFASYPTRAFEDTFARGKFILDEIVHITGRTEAGDKVAEKRRQEREAREAEMGALGGGATADY